MYIIFTHSFLFVDNCSSFLLKFCLFTLSNWMASSHHIMSYKNSPHVNLIHFLHFDSFFSIQFLSTLLKPPNWSPITSPSIIFCWSHLILPKWHLQHSFFVQLILLCLVLKYNLLINVWRKNQGFYNLWATHMLLNWVILLILRSRCFGMIWTISEGVVKVHGGMMETDKSQASSSKGQVNDLGIKLNIINYFEYLPSPVWAKHTIGEEAQILTGWRCGNSSAVFFLQ